MRDPATKRVGVIGLGRVGSGVTACMVRRGHQPAVYDVRPGVIAGLGDAVVPMSSPRDVASASDVVIVAVLDAAQVGDVLDGPDGILVGAADGLVVLVLSTVSVADIRRLAALASPHGVHLVDCGITPGSKAASHEIVAMLGGEAADIAAVSAVVDDFAKAAFHCGPLGSGMTMKLARNLITYGAWRAVREAAELLAGAGLEVATLVDVVDLADPGGTTLMRLVRIDPGSEVSSSTDIERRAEVLEVLMMKDLAAAIELGNDLGVELPLAEVALRHAAQTSGRVAD